MPGSGLGSVLPGLMTQPGAGVALRAGFSVMLLVLLLPSGGRAGPPPGEKPEAIWSRAGRVLRLDYFLRAMISDSLLVGSH